MRVTAASGKDPRGIGGFALRMLPEDARSRCVSAVAAHEPIDVGAFYDVHRLWCWRYYHAEQLATRAETRLPPLTTASGCADSGAALTNLVAANIALAIDVRVAFLSEASRSARGARGARRDARPFASSGRRLEPLRRMLRLGSPRPLRNGVRDRIHHVDRHP